MINNKQDLIAAVSACLAGVASEGQREMVEQWKNRSEKNRMLWERLSDKNALGRKLTALDLTDIDKGWRRIEQRMDRRRTRRMRIGTVAACAAAVAGLVLVIRFGNTGSHSPDMADMQPAATVGAQLILADGSVVPIDEQGVMQISESAGTTIYKDSSHIDYSRNAVPEEAAVIYNEMRIQHGMDYTMTLPDGTQVFMNAQSRLRFPLKFSGGRREVEFEGEAYFSVTKDADNPFIIKTGGVEVAVLGTEFNLRAYGDEAEVVTTLVSGKVQVRDDGNVCDIEPGEQAVYSTQTGEFSTRRVDVDFYTAWCRSEIMFKDATLEDIMKNLGRWYGVEYEFMDEKAAAQTFGGSFKRTRSIEPILDMIGRTGLVTVIWSENKVYFSTEGR